ALNTLTETVCSWPLLNTPAKGVRSTREGTKFRVCTPGIGNHKNGSMPPVKIHGDTGATPAGWPSIVISVSRKPVLPQLCSSDATSLGTQVYQNSSPDWLCA